MPRPECALAALHLVTQLVGLFIPPLSRLAFSPTMRTFCLCMEPQLTASLHKSEPMALLSYSISTCALSSSGARALTKLCLAHISRAIFSFAGPARFP